VNANSANNRTDLNRFGVEELSASFETCSPTFTGCRLFSYHHPRSGAWM
jgi:hypothetical protein